MGCYTDINEFDLLSFFITGITNIKTNKQVLPQQQLHWWLNRTLMPLPFSFINVLLTVCITCEAFVYCRPVQEKRTST